MIELTANWQIIVFLLGVGAVFGAAIAIGLCLYQVLWDAFRAASLTRWWYQVLKVNKPTKPLSARKWVKLFFLNWWRLLFLPKGSYSVSGPGGYWKEWNDYRVRVIPDQSEKDQQHETD